MAEKKTKRTVDTQVSPEELDKIIAQCAGRYGTGMKHPHAYGVIGVPWMMIALCESNLVDLSKEDAFYSFTAEVYRRLMPVCNDPELRKMLNGCDLVEYLADSASLMYSEWHSAQEVALSLLKLQAAGLIYLDENDRLHARDNKQLVEKFGPRFCSYKVPEPEFVKDETGEGLGGIIIEDLDSDEEEYEDWWWLKLPRDCIYASPEEWDDAGVHLGTSGIE